MPTIGSITKTIRINPRDLEVIERIMEEENTSWSGAIHKLIADEGVHPTKKSLEDETLGEIGSMANFFGMTLGDFLNGVLEGLNEGYLTVNNKRVEGIPNIQIDEFLDVCHERGLEAQKTLDKMTKTLRNGK